MVLDGDHGITIPGLLVGDWPQPWTVDLVVRDTVLIDSEEHEDALDWFAQAINGDVYYCGEEVKDYESFERDNPREPELIEIAGSFKQGRNGDSGYHL